MAQGRSAKLGQIPDHAQQYWVQVEHKEYKQTEATLVNFKIYQNIPVYCVHCVDLGMKALWGLDQVRGRNFAILTTTYGLNGVSFDLPTFSDLSW